MSIRKILTLSCALLLSLWGALSFADNPYYTIEDYVIDMEIHKDGSMQVKEDISVNFHQERRWIIRKIPKTFHEGGFVQIRNFEVAEYPYSYSLDSDHELKIGDPYVFHTWKKTYQISYLVENAISVFSGYNELYRNIIGTKRDTEILKSSFTIKLPADEGFDKASIGIVHGREGAEEKDWGTLSYDKEQQMVIGKGSKSLKAGEGLTVGLKFNENYFSFPKGYLEMKEGEIRGFNKFLKIISSLFFPLLIVSLLFFQTFYSKKARRIRARKKKTITIYYTPPKNVDILLAMYIYAFDYTGTSFTAMLYYWANQWWITIEQVNEKARFFSKNEYRIKKGASSPTDPLHTEIYDKFFWWKDTIDLSSLSHEKMKSLKETLLDKVSDIEEATCGVSYKENMLDSALVEWEDNIYDQLEGYKLYLSKVEKPVLEQCLKDDPLYVDKALPWLIFFGIDVKFLKLVEEIIGKEYQPSWAHSNIAYAAMISSMNSSFSTNLGPQWRGSGFSGGGGFSGSSGGGGWGGGGSSW